MRDEKLVSNSERKMFKECRRKWWLTFYRKLALIREETGTAASLGTRVHGALDVFYSGASIDETLAQMAERDVADLDGAPGDEKLAKEIELARIMVEGYFEWLAEEGADEGLEVISSEESREVPIDLSEHTDRKVKLVAKLDVRVRRESDGAILFVDHKTVQSFEERIRLLHLDEQMKTYHLIEFLLLIASGADAEATRTDGALYNMLRKVKRTARAKPPFYAREEIRHNVPTLRSFYAQVYGEVMEILRTEARLDGGEDPIYVVPPNPSRDCSWKCPFLPVCPMLDDSSKGAERVIHSYYHEADPLARYATDKETT